MGNKKKVVFTKENLAWGLTALIVVCLSIVFYLVLTQMSSIQEGLSKVTGVLMPIILGCIMAYLLLPVYNSLNRILLSWLSRSRLNESTVRSLSKGLSTGLSLTLLILVVVGLFIIAAPQILQSITDIVRAVPSNADKFSNWVTKMLKNYPEILGIITQAINDFETSILGIVTDYVIPSMNTLITGITSGVISVLSFLFDALIGLIVCIYILNSKERFAAQSKKLIYSMFDTERANEIIADARNVHRIFSGFISGKLLDSLIIGMISFVALSCMNMPYAVMISVVVGVTNIIPFFGPFIGAVPSAVIIFTVSPIKSLYFIIYILIIQQIDGNIIGPKILGNSTGLPSFWVLFAIVVGGGLFGFAGMLLGVPVFAVIYMFVSEGIVRALKKRGLPEDTDKYDDIMEIDPETHEIKAFRSEENIKNEQQTVIDTKEDPE
jgi:predicted PurR-regulated permease PerM